MVFFERCVKSVSLIGDSVDRTAETQGIKCIKDTEISCDDRTKRLICLTFIGRFDMLTQTSHTNMVC